MISRSYTGGQTTNYHLPIIDNDDLDSDDIYDTQISAFLEQRFANIADWQLYGCIKGFGVNDLIISEGDMYLEYSDDGSNATCYLDTIKCFMNFIYIEQENISWGGLIPGTTYYLFLKIVEENTDTPSGTYRSSREFFDVDTIAKTGLAESNTELFIATVTPPIIAGYYGTGIYGVGVYGA